MKAAVVTEIGKLEVLDLPVPKPGPYEALCKMCYGSTCAGTDIHLTDGKHPFEVSYPTVLGHESVGRVVETGCKVRNFKVGDLISRVGYPADAARGISSNWGGFAQYGIAKDHWQMQKDGIARPQWERSRVNQIIHPMIGEKTAPMIITWRETLSYLRRIGVGEGKKVMLIGSGANALSFAAHACNLGAEVTVTGSIKRKNIFCALPVVDYIDYKIRDLAANVQKDGVKSFDLILDAVGAAETANELLPLLKRGGTVGVYGWNDRAGYGLNPFLARDSFSVYAGGYDEEESNAEVQSMVLKGRLKAEMWYDVSDPVPLGDIGAAYQRLRRHEAVKYLVRL